MQVLLLQLAGYIIVCFLASTHEAYSILVLLIIEVMPCVSPPRYDLYNKDPETEHV